MPERAYWSIPIKPEEEHMLAVPGSGGFSVLLMQERGKEYTPETRKKNMRSNIIAEGEF